MSATVGSLIGLQGSLSLSPHALRFLRTTLVLVCVAAVTCAFLPNTLFIATATRLAPDHLLEETTLALLSNAHLILPGAGLMGLIWIVVAPRASASLNAAAAAVTSSPWSLPAIVFVSILVRIGWLYWFPTQPYADSVGYMSAAAHLLHGEGYVWDTETMQPLAGWPVGYPAILAALFKVTGIRPATALALNVAVSAMTVAQTAWLGSVIFGRRVGLFASSLLALFPGFVVYSSLIGTDLVFVWLTSLCFFSTVRRAEQEAGVAPQVSSGAITGLVAGAAALVRATGLLLLPFWAIMRWSSERNLKKTAVWAAALLAASTLVVIPWTARNFVRFGRIIPVSTNGGMNFWIGNNANAHGAYMFPHDATLNPLFPLAERRDEIGLETEGYRLGSEWLRETLRTDPLRVVALYRAKIIYFTAGFDYGLHWNNLSAVKVNQPGGGLTAHVLVNVAYLAMLVGVLFGALALLLTAGHGSLLQWGPLFFYFYWLAIHLPFFGQDRFMLPALPGLIIFCALGASKLFDATLTPPAFGRSNVAGGTNSQSGPYAGIGGS